MMMGCTLLLAVVGCAPTQAAPLVSNNNNNVAVGGCLNGTAEKDMQEAVKAIDSTFKAVVVSLNIAATFEKDPKTKQDLLEAATVIQDVDQFIVENITKILNGPCATCEQITAIVQEGVQALEEALTKIDPAWKSNPIYKDIVAAVNTVLSIVEAICPSSTSLTVRGQTLLVLPRNGSCLTPAQNATMEKVLKAMDTVIKAAVASLRLAAALEKNNQTKQDLLEAALVLEAVDQDIVENITNILSGPCATCDQITSIVQKCVASLEQALTKIDPDWEKNPIYKDIVTVINDILTLVKEVCPDSKAIKTSKLLRTTA